MAPILKKRAHGGCRWSDRKSFCVHKSAVCAAAAPGLGSPPHYMSVHARPWLCLSYIWVYKAAVD